MFYFKYLKINFKWANGFKMLKVMSKLCMKQNGMENKNQVVLSWLLTLFAFVRVGVS